LFRQLAITAKCAAPQFADLSQGSEKLFGQPKQRRSSQTIVLTQTKRFSIKRILVGSHAGTTTNPLPTAPALWCGSVLVSYRFGPLPGVRGSISDNAGMRFWSFGSLASLPRGIVQIQTVLSSPSLGENLRRLCW